MAKPAHEQHPAVGAGRYVRFEAEGISGYALIGERDVPHAAFAGRAEAFASYITCAMRSEPGTGITVRVEG